MEFHGLSELESFQMTLMWVGLTLRHRLSSNALLTIMWHSMGVQAANQRVLPFSRRIKPTISMWTSLAGPLSVRATSSKTNTPFIRKLATRWYWTIPMYTSLRLARRAKKKLQPVYIELQHNKENRYPGYWRHQHHLRLLGLVWEQQT